MKHLACALCLWAVTAVAEETPSLRRPVAIALSSDEAWLYVACERSGSVCAVDLQRGEKAAEASIGARLAALQRLGEDRLLTVDSESHELLLLAVDGPHVEVVGRAATARHPVDLAVLDERRLVVSSLWSRRLTLLERDGDSLRQRRLLDMPWAPRRLLPLGEDRLLAADAFGGRLALIDMKTFSIAHQHAFPAHNIRGLQVSRNGKMLLVAHQMLNELAHTVRNDVHWGLLMSNDLRWMPLDRVLTGRSDLYEGAHMHPLGEAGSATSDPSAVAVAADGTAIVALGGVGEIAVGQEHDFSLHRIEVGRRPTALAVTADSGRAYVACTFDDAVTEVDLAKREAVRSISLGTLRELTLAERGELLFYDGELSHDRWMSCHSCHTDGHTNGQLNDNLSDQTFGAPKRVLSLLGKRDTLPLAWDAGTADFAAQIRSSVQKTMQRDREPSEQQVAALTAFLESLPPPPPLDAARDTLDAAAVERGRAVFAAKQCADCHAPPAYTTPRVYDVGLEDELGRKKFNPPALRGVSQRGPFLHDGRAATLRSVFSEHDHPPKGPVAGRELEDLLAFLRSL